MQGPLLATHKVGLAGLWLLWGCVFFVGLLKPQALCCMWMPLNKISWQSNIVFNHQISLSLSCGVQLPVVSHLIKFPQKIRNIMNCYLLPRDHAFFFSNTLCCLQSGWLKKLKGSSILLWLLEASPQLRLGHSDIYTQLISWIYSFYLFIFICNLYCIFPLPLISLYSPAPSNHHTIVHGHE